MNAIAFLQKLSRVDPVALAREILEQNTEILADKNAEQLAQGISSDGKRTTLYGRDFYAERTIEIKSRKSGLASVTDRITGYNTGSLYRNLYARLEGDRLEYGSSSGTAPLFEKQASNRIYGPTEENRIEFIDTILRPRFLEAIDRALI